MKYIVIFTIMVLTLINCSSKSTHEKMLLDIEDYKSFFKDNLNTFNVIEDSLNNINVIQSETLVNQELQVLPDKIKFENSHKLEANWNIRSNSLNNGERVFFINMALPEMRSNCTAFSYFYSSKGNIRKAVSNSGRNVDYKILNDKWALEVDNSSPCID